MNDPLQILREFNAGSFLRAYERCMNPPDQGLGMPALMCAAFSAELGLKELIRKLGGAVKKQHRYSDLLGLLPPNEVASIRAELTPRWPDLDAQMAKADDAFVQWRYFFESPTPIEVNVKFVADFAPVVLVRVGGACLAA
jgi:hypothetical protein